MPQLYVPSTRDVDVPLTPEAHRAVADRAAGLLNGTHSPANGFWVGERGLVQEPIHVVTGGGDVDRVAKNLARTMSQWAVTTRHGNEHRFVKPDGTHESLPHLVEVHVPSGDVTGLKLHMAALFGGGTHAGNVVYSAHTPEQRKHLIDLYRYVMQHHPGATVKEVS